MLLDGFKYFKSIHLVESFVTVEDAASADTCTAPFEHQMRGLDYGLMDEFLLTRGECDVRTEVV